MANYTEQSFEQRSSDRGTKKSSYSSFMQEAERLIRMKETYEAMLLDCNFNEPFLRSRIIRYAMLLRDESLWDLLDESERFELTKRVSMISSADSSIKQYAGFGATGVSLLINKINDFERYAHDFLQYYGQLMIAHGVSLIVSKEKDMVEKLYSIAQVAPVFKNAYGIPISPQMELFCRMCYVRAMDNWDNVIVEDGEPGVGKTSFGMAFGTTLSAMFGNKYSIYQNLLIKESREYALKLMTEAPRFTFLHFDEAGNQLNSKSWYVDEQLDLVNQLNLIRFHGLTLLFVWPDIRGIDTTVRNRRATYVVNIKRRGEAIVRTFNKNPYAKDSQPTSQKYKNAILSTNQAAGEMLGYDALTVMKIPYYEIPAKTWQLYEARKNESAKTVFKLKSGNERKQARDYFIGFLVQADSSKERISNEEIEKFGIEHNYHLSTLQLARFIAYHTGEKFQSIWHNTDIADSQKGYIDITKFIRAYMERLNSEKKGQDDSKKENISVN